MPAELCALLFTGLLATGSAKPTEAADVEMLEFLGNFETQDGQWLDPLSLDDRDPTQSNPEREETQHE